jgi:hypothetical protein
LILVAAFLPAWQAANGSAAANSSVAAADLDVLHRRAAALHASGLHMCGTDYRFLRKAKFKLLCMPILLI